MTSRLALGAMLTTLAAASVPGQPPYRAGQVVGMESFAAPEGAADLLLANGFVAVHVSPPLRQVFSAYVQPRLPTFVTTDLVLDAYAEVLQELVLELERHQARWLLDFSRALSKTATRRGSPEGRRLAQLAEVALALQTGATPEDPHARRLLDRLDRSGVRLFDGMATTLAADLRPMGAYAGEPELAAYFRARRFYQRCRFDLGQDKGRALADTAAGCLAGDQRLGDLFRTLNAPFDALLGRRQPGVSELSRKDTVPPRRGTVALLPAFRTPLLELVERADRQGLGFESTGMVMLAAGPFASEPGARIWRASCEPADLPELLHPVPAPESHYGQFLSVLRRLQEPDPRAPALFRSPAWSAKQAFTQLGAWAEVRHVFTLQAEPFSRILRTDDPPPPRISPYPEVFAGVARCAEALHAFWRRTSRELVDLAEVQRDLKRALDLDADTAALTFPLEAEQRRALLALDHLWQLVAGADRLLARPKALAACAVPPEQLPDADRALLEDFAAGPVLGNLERLVRLADRLAALAHVQLEAGTLDRAERDFLARIGREVALLHGYTGNSWLRPEDDHPRVTAVGRDAFGRPLHVGVAHPDRLYLILPVDGRPTLYVGAALSYREQVGGPAMTDAEWRALVRSGKAPGPPAFTESFRR